MHIILIKQSNLTGTADVTGTHLKTLQFLIQYSHARNDDNVVNRAIQMIQINKEAFYEQPLQQTGTMEA